jgi:thiol-disulfide isomerase/thioredoxin
VLAITLPLAAANALPASLRLNDLAGRPVEAASLRGRVVVVDVWATWCAPCLADLPTLRELHHAFPDEVRVVGVSLDRMSRRDLRSWLRRHDVRWPQHHDGRGYGSPIVEQLNVTSLPASLLLDRDGRLVARNLRGSALLSAVRSLVPDRRLP